MNEFPIYFSQEYLLQKYVRGERKVFKGGKKDELLSQNCAEKTDDGICNVSTKSVIKRTVTSIS